MSQHSDIPCRAARDRSPRVWLPLSLVALVLATSCGRAPAPASTAPASARSAEATIAPAGYHTVLAEEFDGDSLDTRLWNTELTWGTRPESELEEYSAEALAVKDGMLTITASKTPGAERGYRSGVIASFGKFDFTYGRVEMRAKIPPGRGMWPAFWMLCRNEDLHREIDITEVLGRQPQRSYMTLHYRDGADRKYLQSYYDGVDLTKDFHTYAIDWEPGRIEWYLDGVKRYEVADEHVPKDPMYLIANLAIGGRWGGAPDDRTVFPAQMRIDYIRVFQRD